ncbi:hypothetical protein V6N12_023539 [Hibiscus sabdariffa]|uniref:Uncharacterized protein n=1 Tax=Hibiscus sabdariffa TaxID=183260 RepID=A0ABR2FYD0_9ROSI
MSECVKIIAVADKEDVEKTEYELKQDAEVTDDVESELGLKDGGEGIDTSDPFTLCLELETRFCRLEKRDDEEQNIMRHCSLCLPEGPNRIWLPPGGVRMSPCPRKTRLNCFSCCMSDETQTRRTLQKSIEENHDTKVLALFANISFNPDNSRMRFTCQEIGKDCNDNATAKVFKYREICTATDNFNPRNQIGEGGFGRVYKGLIENQNRVHYQILSLYLCYSDLCLPPDKTPLDWNTRMRIAAKPLMDHRRKFALLADPLLDGDIPVKSLHQALTVAATCLQEEPSLRPLMSYVVAALESLITGNGPEGGNNVEHSHH